MPLSGGVSAEWRRSRISTPASPRRTFAAAGARAGAEPRDPADPDELGQGRPQRALPLRLGQEIQALPRTACLTPNKSAASGKEAADLLRGQPADGSLTRLRPVVAVGAFLSARRVDCYLCLPFLKTSAHSLSVLPDLDRCYGSGPFFFRPTVKQRCIPGSDMAQKTVALAL